MINNILEVSNLKKAYGERVVVNDLSFSICRGEVFGFVGPNGAGKTTTMKIILGLVHPSSGEIKINNIKLNEDFESAIAQVGAVIEYPSFYPFLSGLDNLKLTCRMYGDQLNRRMDELISMVGLSSRINDQVCKYSLGMKQRLGICRALIGTPQLLILDEPTNGLDPDGVIEFRKILNDIVSNEHLSVMISGHILSELDKICERALIIDNGKYVSTVDIKKNSIYQVIRIVTEQLDEALTALSLSSSWEVINSDSISISVKIHSKEVQNLIMYLINKSISINSFSAEKEILENAYINLIKSKKEQSNE